ncbi:D-arabinose 1-dehydrogenase [Aureococcus anophagefferens]|nr:D-arabinose 1-dehydrogenase [Aureococcus anophagefferens]
MLLLLCAVAALRVRALAGTAALLTRTRIDDFAVAPLEVCGVGVYALANTWGAARDGDATGGRVWPCGLELAPRVAAAARTGRSSASAAAAASSLAAARAGAKRVVAADVNPVPLRLVAAAAEDQGLAVEVESFGVASRGAAPAGGRRRLRGPHLRREPRGGRRRAGPRGARAARTCSARRTRCGAAAFRGALPDVRFEPVALSRHAATHTDARNWKTRLVQHLDVVPD